VVLVVFIILIRCIFPRPRMDQMIKIGWNYLTPIALLNLFIVLALKLWGIV
jgi:NADH:ubiquinone oxidoreductase subunit H